MRAEINPGYEKERVKLADAIPLSTPFRLTIGPTHFCNFKCFYCTHSVDDKKMQEIGFNKKTMDYESFVKLADQLKEFPERIKLIAFSGVGEPLLNKKLPDMIAYLKKIDVADKIEIFTNGAMLTKDTTHKLVDAGVDRIKLSLQGLNAEKYKEISNVDINFDEFIENISYFYKNRGDCKLYIKIIDSILEKDEEKNFYDMFGNICDEIFIEHLFSCQTAKGDCDGLVDESLTVYQEKAIKTEVCQLLFYSLMCDAEGNLFPCASLGLPKDLILGNIKEKSLFDLWNSDKLKELRRIHLQKKSNEIPTCRDCGNYFAMYHKEDDIDHAAEKLLKYFD